jgi:hypothetical protein
MSAISRIRNLVVLAALVQLLALSAGCIGGPDSFPDGDIVVLKLAADGAPCRVSNSFHSHNHLCAYPKIRSGGNRSPKTVSGSL